MPYNGPVKRAEREGAILEVWYDLNPISPREYDNFSKIVLFHPDYSYAGDAVFDHPEHFFSELGWELDQNFLYQRAEELFRIEQNPETNEWDVYKGDEVVIGGLEEEDDALAEMEYLKDQWVDDFREHEEELMKLIEEKAFIYPLFAYIHSGIRISMNAFSDPWDSGQIGWIYVSKRRAREELPELNDEQLEAKVKEIFEEELEDFNDYLEGEVYGYKLYKTKKCECCGHVSKEEIDSCWGFMKNYLEEGIKNHIEKEYHDLVDNLEDVFEK